MELGVRIVPAVQSSNLKTLASEQLRQSLLGNSFHSEIVALLVGHWAFGNHLVPGGRRWVTFGLGFIMDGRLEFVAAQPSSRLWKAL